MTGQRMKSKWQKTNFLLQSPELTPYIPATQQWSRTAFQTMLEQYAMVYVKPDIGTYGQGVIRAEKKPHGLYTFQIGTRLYTFASFDAMTDRLQRLIGSRRYLIQQGIHLLRHNQRRFDIRVMVQKNPAKQWEATGIIGRLGNPHKIVTNYHSGGTPLPFELLMQTHLAAEEMPLFQERLNKLCLDIAFQLEKDLPKLKEIGVDIAVDLTLQPWILEVNTRPDPYIFRNLNNKSVYRKIYRYCVSYGRIKPGKRIKRGGATKKSKKGSGFTTKRSKSRSGLRRAVRPGLKSRRKTQKSAVR